MPGAGLFSPLSVAALLTWAAIVSGPWVWLWQRAAPVTVAESAGIAAQWLMLALFVWHTRAEARPEQPARNGARVIGQMLTALAACAAFDDGAQPVLLVLVASQAALVWNGRTLALLLLLMNAALLGIVLLHKPHASLLRIGMVLLAYGGFQLFAVVVAGYARKAEIARDEALRLNAELHATRELLAYGARADERLRLSRELHDVAGHKLTALKLQLALFERRADPALKPALTALHALADELLADVRAVVSTLRHHEGIDLHAALTALAQAFVQPRVTVTLDERARAPGIARAEALLRVAQEALANAARHSRASEVALHLGAHDDGLRLQVRDNGIGLATVREGNGLTGMRERLTALGGRLHIESAPGGGLCLTATLPLPTAAAGP